MVEQISSFYNTLLSIEVPVYMAILALILVFVQIIYAQYSFREVAMVFKSRLLIFSAIFALLEIALTSCYSIKSTYANGSMFNFESYNYEMLGIIILISFFVPLILLIIFIIRNISILRPNRIILAIFNSINVEKIKYYLLKKFGILKPRTQSLSRPY